MEEKEKTTETVEQQEETAETVKAEETQETQENKESEVKEKKSSEKDKKSKELEEAKKLAEEYKDKWMRNVAEFDNYKKRNAKIWQDAYNEGVVSTVIKILPVGDNLDWALTMGLDEKTAEGIKNLKKKYEETLKTLEVEEINPVGEKFDPNIAEAVMQVEGEEGDESETVKQVFQKGYKIKEKIIRYAKVSVVK